MDAEICGIPSMNMVSKTMLIGANFVVDQLVEGIRRFKQRNSVWVHGCILFLQVLLFFLHSLLGHFLIVNITSSK